MSFDSHDQYPPFDEHPSEDAYIEAPVAAMLTEKVRSFNFIKNDVNLLMFDLVPELVKNAREAALNLHESDRGYAVGAAALGYDSSQSRPRVATYVAGNYKTHLYDTRNKEVDVPEVPALCAEQDILYRADHREIERIPIIVIAGTVNGLRVKEVNNVLSTMLDPCANCDNAMAVSPMIDQNTIIMTVGTDQNECRVQRYPQYHQRYEYFRQEGTYDHRGVVSYSDHEWEMKRMAYEIELQKSHIEHAETYGEPDAQEARRFVAAEMMIKG